VICLLPEAAAAEHGIAVDRFAREIVRILKALPGALAATECQTVGPVLTLGVSSMPLYNIGLIHHLDQ